MQTFLSVDEQSDQQKFCRPDRPKQLLVWLSNGPGDPDYFVLEGDGYTIESVLGDLDNPNSQGTAEQVDFRDAMVRCPELLELYGKRSSDRYCIYHNGSDYAIK